VQAGGDAQQKQQQDVGGNRIQVSSSKKPLFFYVNLAKVSIRRSISRLWLLAARLRPSSSMAVVSWLVLILVGLCFVQRYMQQHGDVELSALGLGESPSWPCSAYRFSAGTVLGSHDNLSPVIVVVSFS